MKHQNSAVQGDFVNVSQNIDSPRGLILGNKVENLSCAVTSGVFCVTTSTMPGQKSKTPMLLRKQIGQPPGKLCVDQSEYSIGQRDIRQSIG